MNDIGINLGKKRNFANQIVGDFKVLRAVEINSDRRLIWECECLRCGNRKLVNQRTLSERDSYNVSVNCVCGGRFRKTLDEITEDEVSLDAWQLLGFNDKEIGVKQSVGQRTTFNMLDLYGIDKPDGWYLPHDTQKTAIIAEFKSSLIPTSNKLAIEELKKNVDVAMKKYDNVIGILYNGVNCMITKNNKYFDVQDELKHKSYYLSIV